jgi:hypothetical protein
MRPAALIAAVVLVVLAVFATRYGYHRDELYFVAAGHHLAWAYDDQGPLTPAIAGAIDSIFPGSLFALRLPPALMAAAIVLLAGVIARELGGDRRAETMAAACTAISAVVLATGHLLSTTTFDLLAWTVVSWLIVRSIRSGDDRLWLPAGFVTGLALLDKPLAAFLVAALFVSILIAGPRRLVLSPWVIGGAVVALIMWAPWLIWQSQHDWPQIDVARSITAGGSTSSQPRWAFLPYQLLLSGPFLAPVWIAGLIRLLRDERYRFLGLTWVVLAIAFIVTGGKPYYVSGLLPLLIAAGAPAAVGWVTTARTRRIAFGAAFAVSAAIAAIASIPVLPEAKAAPAVGLNGDVGETIGWPSFAAQVDRVAPPHAIAVTSNYGEAGALRRFGHIPAYSGHNAYWRWGPPPPGAAPVVVVGFDPVGAAPHFTGCRVAATIKSPHDIDNDENGALVQVCTAPRRPWAAEWPSLRSLG